jgi:hypothetical protein
MNSLLQNETSMMLGSVAGSRCRANRQIRTHAGNVRPSTLGRIIGEIDSVGRRLFLVRWNNDVCAYAFPHEIDIVSDDSRNDLAA